MTAPVLIIGAGIAGLWTALKLAPRRVRLVTGAPLGVGATTGWAQGGVAAALGADDDPELHVRDTLTAGAGLVDPEAARALAEGAPQAVRELAALGAPFEREGGNWHLSKEAAHSRARVARVNGDQAGRAIMETLIEAVRTADHVEIIENAWARALLPAADGGCAGALIAHGDGRSQEIRADQTVLATGGAAGLFAVATVPQGAQGQAMAMAARLGAEIADAEFIQFHPTAVPIEAGPAPLATEALRGEGAVLIDHQGERFMPGLHPDAELAPRDVVARAVHRQVVSGKGAYLDARAAVGEAFPERFPTVFKLCMDQGVDPRSQPIPIAPAAHYSMGGVATDSDGRASVKGLWAVGECASAGLHGANRLASNSLAEGLVFGARCAAALKAQEESQEIEQLSFPVELAPSIPALALARLRELMAAHCGVERDGEGLALLIAEIDELIAAHGLADALLSARFIAEAALRRAESRGGHYRADFPDTAETAARSRLRLADLFPHSDRQAAE